MILNRLKNEEALAFVWLFSTVRFKMSPQSTCMRRGIVTLAAFVWLFSSVCFQMSPQIASVRGCMVTLITFYWLFSTVCFQVYPQAACPRRCKVTLAAPVWLISICCPSHCNIGISFAWNTLCSISVHHHYMRSVVPCQSCFQTENKSCQLLIEKTKMESGSHPSSGNQIIWLRWASPTSAAKQEVG